MKTHLHIAAAKTKCDDKALVLDLPDGALLATLADGATGCGQGHIAASLFVAHVASCAERLAEDPSRLPAVLAEADGAIARAGIDADTTGVILLVRKGKLWTVAAGDSEAWMGTPRGPIGLTRRARRRPRIGGGILVPELEGPFEPEGPVIVASDGLFASLQPAEALAIAASAEDPALALAQAVRNKHGGYPDDFSAIVLAAPTPTPLPHFVDFM